MRLQDGSCERQTPLHNEMRREDAMSRFDRTIRLIGLENQEKLFHASVAVFGIGGVGSFVAEALARAGVGHLLFVDGDVVEESNINRQLIATCESVGRPKSVLMMERARTINPAAKVEALRLFYDESTQNEIDLSLFSYIVDAIDSVSSKLLLISNARSAGTKVISCMGAGNKLDPTMFRVDYIEKTKVCPLAKVMRKRLRDMGIEKVKVVYSEELPRPRQDGERAPGFSWQGTFPLE